MLAADTLLLSSDGSTWVVGAEVFPGTKLRAYARQGTWRRWVAYEVVVREVICFEGPRVVFPAALGAVYATVNLPHISMESYGPRFAVERGPWQANKHRILANVVGAKDMKSLPVLQLLLDSNPAGAFMLHAFQGRGVFFKGICPLGHNQFNPPLLRDGFSSRLWQVQRACWELPQDADGRRVANRHIRGARGQITGWVPACEPRNKEDNGDEHDLAAARGDGNRRYAGGRHPHVITEEEEGVDARGADGGPQDAHLAGRAR